MDKRQERVMEEIREGLEGLPWWDLLAILAYCKWIRARGWLHRTRIALDWTYREIR